MPSYWRKSAPYNFFSVDVPHPKTASNGHSYFSQPYLLHFMYLCPADFTDKCGWGSCLSLLSSCLCPQGVALR